MLSNSIKELVRKYAAKNAFQYGKANEGSVFNKVLSKAPEAKSDMQELRTAVKQTVEAINQMDLAALKELYSGYDEEFTAEEQARAERTAKPKMKLEGVIEGVFAARFPPEPSGYMHIGHTKQLFLSQEFSRIYKGKLFLYFDDTNPKKEKQEFVDAYKKDLSWLGVAFDEEYYASDGIEKVYDLCRQLIATGNAYACSCTPDTIKKNRFSGTACEHRELPAKQNIELFDQMIAGKYDEDQIIIRLKGDMASQNTTMRDPTIMRVVKVQHYRQGHKYVVWPTYFLNTPIMDSLHGVTDVLRSKEYEQSEEMYEHVLKSLQMRVPRLHAFSRLRVLNNVTQKREIRAMIDDGTLTGFDDPRLITITALRRRGITPQAIREFVLKSGMSKMDTSVDLTALFAENKKVIDPTSKRLFFVHDPVKVTVAGDLPKSVELPLHPTDAKLGSRKYTLGKEFYISTADVQGLKAGSILRLKNLAAIKVLSAAEDGIGAEVSSSSSGAQVVQWVPADSFVQCKVTMPMDLLGKDGKLNKDSLKAADGYAESYVSSLREHETVQFERFGFCILDRKEPLEFIFISK